MVIGKISLTHCHCDTKLGVLYIRSILFIVNTLGSVVFDKYDV